MQAWYPEAVPGSHHGAWAAMRGGGGLPIVEVLDDRRLVQARDAGGVGEQMPHFHGLLAGSPELRPVAGDGREHIQFAPRDEHQHRQAGDRLGRRPDIDDRVLLPRLCPCFIPPAAPQVDQHLALEVDDDRRAQLLAGGNIGLEDVPDLLEPAVAPSVHQPHHPPPTPRAGQTVAGRPQGPGWWPPRLADAPLAGLSLS